MFDRQFWLRDLGTIWVAITLTLAYLEVPIANAPLFATAVVLQAALGTVVILWLLPGAQASLLLALGPGLILGGALSFAVFQIVGRGVVGVIATLVFGLAAAVLLVRKFEPEPDAEPRWWMLGQLVGMGMLAITPEFTELLPVAIVTLVLGYLADPAHRRPRVLLPSLIFGVSTALLFWTWRQKYWWLINDDHLLFEVLAQHIFREGPFADWGVTSFAKYHWLSYGWAGFLDHLGGSPTPLTTLSKVMPIVYAVSLSASVLGLRKRFLSEPMTMTLLIPVWAVVAVGRFEWSATSTGGVYATIAASVLIVALAQQLKTGFGRTVLILGIFSGLVATTKLPSIFVIVLVMWSVVFTNERLTSTSIRHKYIIVSFGVVAAIPFIMMMVNVLDEFLGGRIEFRLINQALGQLSTVHPVIAISLLVLNQVWLWLGVTMLVIHLSRGSMHFPPSSSWLVKSIGLSMLLGIIFEVSIAESHNGYTYFSGPMYFLASLALLCLPYPQKKPPTSRAMWSRDLLWVNALLILGYLWVYGGVAENLWGAFITLAPGLEGQGADLLVFFTRDPRIPTTVLVFAIFITFLRRRRGFRLWTPWLLVLVVLSISNLLPDSVRDYRQSISDQQAELSAGPQSSQELGIWLRSHTDPEDLIATNHLFGEDGGSIANLALGAWSQREFLILGPGLSYEMTPQRTEALRLSRAFATNPNQSSCRELQNRDVRWFIVDTNLTVMRDWRPCTTRVYSIGKFVVLAMSGDR